MKDQDQTKSLPPLKPATSAGVASSKDAPGGSAASFGKLAKRITGITSNCLFTAIVLVAGLGVGRQIMRWWSADAPRQNAAPLNCEFTDGLGDPARLHILQFGGQAWSMARREFHGSREQAEKQFQRDCREEMRQTAIPAVKNGQEQQTLLASLAKTTAIDAELPHWQLFAVGENRLILVGVKPSLTKGAESFVVPPSGGDSGRKPAETGTMNQKPAEVAASQVVLWGIALPKGTDEWTEILFSPSKEECEAIPLLTDIPLPPKSRKMLSIQAVNGGVMVAFSGPGESESWRGHFEKWFTKGGWKPVFPWQNSASAWYSQYRGQSSEKSYSVDVHIFPNGKGEMSGLVIVGAGEKQ
jgi:hypothetical protein